MSVRRSPPETAASSLEHLTKCSKATTEYLAETRSQPDLSKLNEELSEAQITYRKRKQPFVTECACSDEVKLMRNDLSRITSLLENYTSQNTQIINRMNETIISVKNEMTELKVSHEQIKSLVTSNAADISAQIQDIKSTTAIIASDHGNMKSQISQIEIKVTNSEDKIKMLETDYRKLKLSTQTTQTSQLSANEQIIREVQDRKKRENNIIIVGIPEQTSIDTQERILRDESDVLNITSKVSATIPKPNKIFRIGKYKAGSTRRIKVCYDAPESPMLLLRNKEKIPENIKIYSDQTPAQHKYFLAIKEELRQRAESGESDLTIKYINGVPTIIKQASKNFNDQ
ncbi:hypothetical protein PYW07_017322 [Mythimna separata]|uniref:Uncharacterized protein n=1 Tax=Mythimna separata TaxID=271217 RepID=A0AAD8DPH3_MYTSE|nr:hypothetical protein PYW07_004961 [Mythimna separata]KAJ8715515.1 hypothetical protein PYW07_009997 [Mythimna separata]KAJ8730284.1 hypothetical protein PYW07_017322 [Mythimna separata]